MEEKNNLKIFSAPIQGLTELPWRRFHHDIYGDGITSYFTPFLRVERGEVRRRDVRDLGSEMNVGVPLIPQIIFRNLEEFEMLCDTVKASGFDHVDLNMGCPFPPQVHHGRGAGMIANVALLGEVASLMKDKYSDLTFSIKMRLGVDGPEQWRDAMPVIAGMPLSHLTVHPRTARQQYSGELWLDEFSRLLDSTDHHVVFNGDLLAPEDIDRIYAQFPALYGVMIGRGLFSRPSMVAEWLAGEEWTPSRRMQEILRLHALVYAHYKETLSGDVQVLGKIAPFWEYLAPDLDKKAYKGIKKASSLRKYDDAVSMIINNR